MVIRKPPLLTLLLVLFSTTYISIALGAPGDPVGTEFQVNTYTIDAQNYSSTAMDSNGNSVISWNSYGQDGDTQGVFAQRYNSDGTPAGVEFQVNTETLSGQAFPSIAMDADGDFIIAWVSNIQDGDSIGIFAQLYNADSTTNGTEFQVNTYVTSSQTNPSVAIDADGDFVIVWSSDMQDGYGNGIFAQLYHADGASNGTEFQVNTTSMYSQNKPSVAMDADGDFVVTWFSYDGFGEGIYAQRYSNDGNKLGAESLVNTYTTSLQQNPVVAMDAKGNFIITWESLGQDGSSMGIYAQRFFADGTKAGSEFRVNTETGSEQSRPSIAMDADGDFVIAWRSLGQDGSLSGAYAQRYDKSGAISGSEFRVNTETFSSQDIPSVAMDADGDFIVSWSSFQDGDNTGIYAQRYEGEGGLVASSVDLNIVVTDNTDPVVTDTELTYTSIITNNVIGVALDLNLSAQLSTGLDYKSHDGGDWICIEVSKMVSCNLPILDAGASSVVTISASPTLIEGVLNQSVSVNSAQLDATPDDNTDTETTTIKASSVTTGTTPASSESGSGSLDLLCLLLLIPLTPRRRMKNK